jgi:hypothetical protein
MLGFGFLYRKAQATVDNAIAQLVWGLLMVVPLLVALGFTTAAGSNYLHRHYEPEIANLILAGVFFAISAVIAIGYAVRKPETAASEEAKAQEEANKHAESESADSPLSAFSTADRDILLAALTSAAPYAIRPVLTTAFRNLPLLLVLAVAAFVMSRSTAPADTSDVAPDAVPAE